MIITVFMNSSRKFLCSLDHIFTNCLEIHKNIYLLIMLQFLFKNSFVFIKLLIGPVVPAPCVPPWVSLLALGGTPGTLPHSMLQGTLHTGDYESPYGNTACRIIKTNNADKHPLVLPQHSLTDHSCSSETQHLGCVMLVYRSYTLS